MPIRVCVLNSSYEGSNSDMKEFEGGLIVSPAHFFDKSDTEYTFTQVPLKKATAYRQIRELVKSGKFDVFYNLCDGAKDEDRAGIESRADAGGIPRAIHRLHFEVLRADEARNEDGGVLQEHPDSTVCGLRKRIGRSRALCGFHVPRHRENTSQDTLRLA